MLLRRRRLNFDTLGILYVFAVPFVLHPFLSCWMSPHLNDDEVSGFVDERFGGVVDAFRRNFGDGSEREGAAFSVYYRGDEVVRLWGGFADREAGRRWKASTKTLMFSSTKAIASITIAFMVDRGMLSYNDKVIKYWPEYGKFGKNRTTIEDVLTHKAGIPFLSHHITIDEIRDNSETILNNVENSIPDWEPGTASGYHFITFGFILDGIVRKVDPHRRDIRTFFEQEIARPNNLDISIGADKREAPFLARITTPTFWEFTRDCIKDPKMIVMLFLMYVRFDTLIDRIKSNSEWLTINYDTVALNDPEISSLALPAVTGVGNARDTARLLSMVIEKQLISNKTLEMLAEPTLNSWHLEKVTIWPIIKGHGFFYEKHPFVPGKFTFGHPGYGGQFVHMDPTSGLAIVYLSNGLKTGTGELCAPYMRLLKETYNSVREL